MALTRVYVRIRPNLGRELEELAATWNVSTSALVRAVLAEGLATLRQPGTAGWQGPRAIHLTGERAPIFEVRIARRERDTGDE